MPPDLQPDNSPLSILSEARKAVPAVDYALGAAGVAAAGALVTGLLGKGQTSIIILGGMLVAMVLLFTFARLLQSNSVSTVIAAQVLLWAVVIFFCAFLIFTASAVVSGRPAGWAKILNLAQEDPIQHFDSQIDFNDVDTNEDAISSLVAIAKATNNLSQRNGIVDILKRKLRHQSVQDFDQLSREVKGFIIAGIVKIRNGDVHRDFSDGILNDQELVRLGLKNVDAHGVSFTSAFLIGSDFRGSNMKDADFKSASVRGVQFGNADLAGANFEDVDWYNSFGLTVAQIKSVDKAGLRKCPTDTNGIYSEQAFIAAAAADYVVKFDNWSSDEKVQSRDNWKVYALPGGACDAVKGA